MTHHNELQKDRVAAGKRMLTGAGIALLLITIFLMGTGEPNPEWARFWMIRPLIIVPMAGGLGGLCNYLLMKHGNIIGINKPLAVVLSVIIYHIGLWLGFVLGLDGTLWN